MMLIYYDNNITIKLAVSEANKVLQNPLFFKALEILPKFNNTILTPREIAYIIQNSTTEVRIKTYWSVNPLKPWNCVNATTPSFDLIKINTRCFSSYLKTGVNTLIHESVHAADLLNGKLDFTHVDNRNDGEEDNTAPWAIGRLAEKFV